jgi:hypothetical protein
LLSVYIYVRKDFVSALRLLMPPSLWAVRPGTWAARRSGPFFGKPHLNPLLTSKRHEPVMISSPVKAAAL